MSSWDSLEEGATVVVDHKRLKTKYRYWWDTPGDVGLDICLEPDQLQKVGVYCEWLVFIKSYNRTYTRQDVREMKASDIFYAIHPKPPTNLTKRKLFNILTREEQTFMTNKAAWIRHLIQHEMWESLKAIDPVLAREIKVWEDDRDQCLRDFSQKMKRELLVSV